MIQLLKVSLSGGFSVREQCVMGLELMIPTLIGPWTHPANRLLRTMSPTEAAQQISPRKKKYFPNSWHIRDEAASERTDVSGLVIGLQTM
jgi:hypothetical protein